MATTAAPAPGTPLPVAGAATGARRGPAPGTGSTAGEVVVAYLRHQVDAIVRGDPAVRRDEPDAVHAMRVAARRLRSTLATFRPLLDRGQADPLRRELGWWGGVLGGPRDAEVLRDRLRALLAAQPDDLAMGSVGELVEDALRQRHRRAHDALVATLDGERYGRLLEGLRNLVERPSLGRRASRPAARGLRKPVDRSYRRVVAATATAEAATSTTDLDLALHEVRKTAKRARYAGECAVPVLADAAGLARWMRTVQEVLGEHQDSVASRALLRELVAPARTAADGFALGLLYGQEQGRGRAAQDAYGSVIGRALRRGWHPARG